MEHLFANQIDTVLRDKFNLTYLFPYQRLVITNILEAAHLADKKDQGTADWDKKDQDTHTKGYQIVILPTGAGKSLCFQLPAALLTGPTLVIYPLLSLLNDQARRIQESGCTVALLRGGQERSARKALLQQITEGAVQFIITNPETLQDPHVQAALRSAQVKHAVIDEAHCIREWGDSFRPVYLDVGRVLRFLQIPIITAFTATAGEEVLSRIRETVFPETGAHLIRGNPDRENIHYTVQPCISRGRAVTALITQAQESGRLPAIIFCRTRRETMLYAARAAQAVGWDSVFFYHAGLRGEEKKQREEEFFNSKTGVLAATCAYGMGVDKQNVRLVIHTYLPDSTEAFLQESGRAGRDRQQSWSIVLTDPYDEVAWRDAQNPTAVQKMAFGDGCRRDPLLRAMGQEPEGCAGCDRCDHPACASESSPLDLPLLHELHRVLEGHKKTRNPAELIRFLRGRVSWNDSLRGYRYRRGFGMLRHWSSTDVDGAITIARECAINGEEPNQMDPPLPFPLLQKASG